MSTEWPLLHCFTTHCEESCHQSKLSCLDWLYSSRKIRMNQKFASADHISSYPIVWLFDSFRLGTHFRFCSKDNCCNKRLHLFVLRIYVRIGKMDSSNCVSWGSTRFNSIIDVLQCVVISERPWFLWKNIFYIWPHWDQLKSTLYTWRCYFLAEVIRRQNRLSNWIH